MRTGVFSQFTELLALIGDQLLSLNLPYLNLTGNTPPKKRGSVVQRFQAQEVPVMLLSLKTGVICVNLPAADTVIHLNLWWNPAVEEQATARAVTASARTNRCLSTSWWYVQGSIEEHILELQACKLTLANSVLGHYDAGALKFDEMDLAALLAPLDCLTATSPTKEAAWCYKRSWQRALIPTFHTMEIFPISLKKNASFNH